MPRLTKPLILLAALVLLLAACAEDGDEAVEPEVEEPTEDVEEDTEETDEADEAAAELEVAMSPLGEHLVSADGLTLYLFTEDEPGVSNCVDECLANWPALVPAGDEVAVGDGVDPALVDTIEREDGLTQVTYNDWPLYFFINDAGPGDAAGQAVNDVWWVVDPAGEPIEDVAAAEDDEESSGY